MAIQVDLRNSFPYFLDNKRRIALNDIVALHTILQPHMITVATGCSFQQALQILVLLFELNLADGFLLIYHNDDPDIPIQKRKLEDGLPTFPYKYDFGMKETDNPDDLFYDFQFDLKDDIEIEFITNGTNYETINN